MLSGGVLLIVRRALIPKDVARVIVEGLEVDPQPLPGGVSCRPLGVELFPLDDVAPAGESVLAVHYCMEPLPKGGSEVLGGLGANVHDHQAEVGRLEDWKAGRLEGWKTGRLDLHGTTPVSHPSWGGGPLARTHSRDPLTRTHSRGPTCAHP